MATGNRIGRAIAATIGLVVIPALAGCDPAPYVLPFNRYERQTLEGVVERMNASSETSSAELAPPATPTLPRPIVLDGEVRMSLEDAIRLALAHNQDIQIAGLEPLSSEADYVHGTAVYDPSVFMSNTYQRQDRPIASQLDTGSVVPGAYIEKTWAMKGGVKQLTPSGGTWQVYQQFGYLNTNSLLVLPDPQYTTSTTVELDQPLLQGFGDPVNQATIRIAKLNASMSIEDFRQKLMETCAKVIQAYWQVTYDIAVAKATRESVDMAQELLRRENARGRQGVSNDLNISRAASAAATREAELVRLKNKIKTDMDQLKHLLNTPELPTDSEITILPTDAPRYYLVNVDRTWSVTKALSRRPEIAKARAALAVNQERIDATDRLRLPKLDSILKYTMNGLGTTVGPSLNQESFGSLITWSAELDVLIPIGNRAAEADLRKNQIQYLQTVLQAQQLTDQIVQEVNAAVRTVYQGRDEVEATLRAMTMARKVVLGELVRFELGELTNEELLRAQDTYTAAERDYLQALLNFNLAIAEMARAQGTLAEEHRITVLWPQDTRNALEPLGAKIMPKPSPPAAPEVSAPDAPEATTPTAPDAGE